MPTATDMMDYPMQPAPTFGMNSLVTSMISQGGGGQFYQPPIAGDVIQMAAGSNPASLLHPSLTTSQLNEIIDPAQAEIYGQQSQIKDVVVEELESPEGDGAEVDVGDVTEVENQQVPAVGSPDAGSPDVASPQIPLQESQIIQDEFT